MSSKYINDPSQLDSLQYQYWTGVGDGNNFNNGYSVNFQLDGKDFTFIPTDVINKGFTDGNTQHYFSSLLKKDNLQTLREKGQPINLDGVGWYGDFLKGTMGRDTTGILIPTEEAGNILSSPKSFEIGSTYGKKDNIPKTAITGLAQTKKGDYVYQNEIPEGKYPVGGTKWAYNYIDDTGTIKSGAKAAPKSSGGLLGKVAKVVDQVAPIALAFVPGVGPVLSAAYTSGSVLGKGGSIEDAFKAGAVSYGASTLGAEVGGQLGSEAGASSTDFLGTQALGDATTNAVGSGATGFGINSGARIGINAGAGVGAIGLDAGGNLIGKPTSQVFDDGSTLISDSSGKPISGTDSANKPFTVTDGIGKYEDGTLLGGKPEITFGGNLADKSDVDKLLGYNSALASESLVDKDKAKKLADALTNEQPKSNFDPYMLVKGLTQGQQDVNIGYSMNQNPFTFTQQLPIQGNVGQLTASPLDVTDQKRNMAALLRNL